MLCHHKYVFGIYSFPPAPSGGYDASAFELELSGQHQDKYSRQFSSSPESEATDKDQQYAELISSPDVSNQEVSKEWIRGGVLQIGTSAMQVSSFMRP